MDFFDSTHFKEWGIEEDEPHNDIGDREIKMYTSGSFIEQINKKNIHFGMTSEFCDILKKLSAKQKSMMCYYILKFKNNIIFTQGDLEKRISEYTYISAEELERRYPCSISKRIQMIIENLASYSIYMGKPILIGKNESQMGKRKIVPWLFMPEEAEIEISWELYQLMLQSGYLTIANNETSNDNSQVSLTIKAWNHVIQMEQKNKIFIAMAYNTSFSNKYETAVKNAISECGYEPMIIKDKEHNEYIPMEIGYEIATSAALIGDLTEQNNGVYFEAGYARGNHIPVILTCREGEKCHFDVSQYNTIFWKIDHAGMDELKKRLMRRIKATLNNEHGKE